MLDANIKILSELKTFLQLVSENEALLDLFRTNKVYFTRDRKLPFTKLALFISKLCKKTLSTELELFFEQMDAREECTASALSQQRVKMNPLFFYHWNEVLYKCYYHFYGQAVTRWKGYRIVAVDGSNVSLPNTEALRDHFGGQDNQNSSFVLAKTLYHYDVLNELVLFSRITQYRDGELKMAYEAIDNVADDMIMIYDRNFSHYRMIALHMFQEKEKKFVIRAKESQNIIRKFIKSGKDQEIAYMEPTSTAIKGLKSDGFIVDKTSLLKVRLVRVELESPTQGKQVEVLLTNLWEDEHPVGEFKDLYFLRWKVETNIFIQKNLLQLESFSGQTPQSVEQDFYATVMITNLHSVLIKPAQQIVDNKTKHYKYPMKVNKNKSLGTLRMQLIPLFLDKEPEAILSKLVESFTRSPQPVRSGRSYVRKRRCSPTKCKHRTYNNYKQAC